MFCVYTEPRALATTPPPARLCRLISIPASSMRCPSTASNVTPEMAHQLDTGGNPPCPGTSTRTVLTEVTFRPNRSVTVIRTVYTPVRATGIRYAPSAPVVSTPTKLPSSSSTTMIAPSMARSVPCSTTVPATARGKKTISTSAEAFPDSSVPAVALARARTITVLTMSALNVVDAVPSFVRSTIRCSPFPNVPAEVSKTTGTPSGTGLPNASSTTAVRVDTSSPSPMISAGSGTREICEGTAATAATIDALRACMPSTDRTDPTFSTSTLAGRSNGTLIRRCRLSTSPGSNVPRFQRTTPSDRMPPSDAETTDVYLGSVSVTVTSAAGPSPMLRTTIL